MSCKHTDGFDWSHAELDRRNGGWKVECLSCRQSITVRRLASSAEIQRHVAIHGPKQHMSKKERLAIRRRQKELENA